MAVCPKKLHERTVFDGLDPEEPLSWVLVSAWERTLAGIDDQIASFQRSRAAYVRLISQAFKLLRDAKETDLKQTGTPAMDKNATSPYLGVATLKIEGQPASFDSRRKVAKADVEREKKWRARVKKFRSAIEAPPSVLSPAWLEKMVQEANLIGSNDDKLDLVFLVLQGVEDGTIQQAAMCAKLVLSLEVVT